MHFPLGKPILVMTLLAALTGGLILLRPAPPVADLTVWIFAGSHRDVYQPLAPLFQQRTGKSVRIDLISSRALDVRLNSLFMSAHGAREAPDAAELEIGSTGQYFRPPTPDVGFLPLNSFLENNGFREIDSLDAPGHAGWNARLTTDGRIYTFDGRRWMPNPDCTRPDAWIDRIVRSRFAPWTKDGQIFGVPHDVHPVTISYREDLFRQAGIDLASADTWPHFQLLCQRFQSYWASHGFPQRHALVLAEGSSDNLVTILLQRHINIIDSEEHSRLADPRLAETLIFYCHLIAGPRRIAAEAGGPVGSGLWGNDLEQGHLCAVISPDWSIDYLEKNVPSLAGKMRMMPLPRFDSSDAPTSTWGGTMIGIPRACPRPEEAWRLIEFLYFSPQALEARRRQSSIIPPLKEDWDNAAYHQPDPYFGGQKIAELYTRLAEQIPPRFVTPATGIAAADLSVVLNRAQTHLRRFGDKGLQAAVRQWLIEADADVTRRIAHGRITEPADRE